MRHFIILLIFLISIFFISDVYANEKWEKESWHFNTTSDANGKKVPYIYIPIIGYFEDASGNYKKIYTQTILYKYENTYSFGVMLYHNEPSNNVVPETFAGSFHMTSDDNYFECRKIGKWSDFGGLDILCANMFIEFMETNKMEAVVSIHDNYLNTYSFILPSTDFHKMYNKLQ